MKKSFSTKDLTLIGVVAAIYILVGQIAPINLRGNAIQLRLGEGMNHLAIFNKRYIWAMTIGVFFFNLFFGGIGIVDAISGSIQTLIMTTIVHYGSKKVSSLKGKFLLSIIVISAMMFWIAIELLFLKFAPAGSFWLTYGELALSELISLSVGAVIIFGVSKAVDLWA
jgi:uncharacterized membrane protein